MEIELKPFEFFALDIQVQKDLMLDHLDYESIQNLCAAAQKSNDPGAVSFFKGLCDDDGFWSMKTTKDFGVSKKRADTWRKEYMRLHRLPTREELKGCQSNNSKRFCSRKGS